MYEFADLLRSGNAWFYLPSAVLLGALHGLEPGHSKTLMAAFIVAVRGSVAQAVLLGLAATLSHTGLVWLVALAGLYFGSRSDPTATEAYFQFGSGLLMVFVGGWMIWTTRRRLRQAAEWAEHEHGEADADAHGHHHAHHSHAGSAHTHTHGHAHAHEPANGRTEREAHQRVLDTGHGLLGLHLAGAGDKAHFLIDALTPGLLDGIAAANLRLSTERSDGSRTEYALYRRGSAFVSTRSVAEPHEFIVRLHFAHGDHGHDYDLEFAGPGGRHVLPDYAGLDVAAPGYQDPHELAHANDIRRRFANRNVSTGQIVLFGLTAGLIPCPAAISVLLLCLQVQRFALGASIVLCFSIGLALTLVAAGVLAAWSIRHVERRWSGLSDIARRAPYVSGALILALGLWVSLLGLRAMG
ncbi:MAG: nickel/cobalt efflux transporter RcnA [Rhodocyclaceae bacterium]|nr:nickel/cobalt efflux transporter RcnA [Rhodocyclaceae bacterium]MBX3669410.1 nickel/cobalt efflux transporter RcnA [Rhodocyclaceae bacterium]